MSNVNRYITHLVITWNESALYQQKSFDSLIYNKPCVT